MCCSPGHCGAWRNDKETQNEAQQISPLLRRSTLQAQMNGEVVYDLEREAMHSDISSSHHATTSRGRFVGRSLRALHDIVAASEAAKQSNHTSDYGGRSSWLKQTTLTWRRPSRTNRKDRHT